MGKINSIKDIVDIGKKFDIVTETLNIFDMSFLVSGSAMLGVCFCALPQMERYFIRKDYEIFSFLFCIWFAYVLGLICRVSGKYITMALCRIFKKRIKEKNQRTKKNVLVENNNDAEFPAEKPNGIIPTKSLGVFIVKDEDGSENVKCMTDSDVENVKNYVKFCYSYMWMKLDTSRNPDCRRRFLYVSRIWVLKAIFEGLIPPVLFLSTIMLCKYDELFTCKCFSNNYYVGFPIIILLTVLIVAFLVMESLYCDKSLRREVEVAYYDFYIEPEEEETDVLNKRLKAIFDSLHKIRY